MSFVDYDEEEEVMPQIALLDEPGCRAILDILEERMRPQYSPDESEPGGLDQPTRELRSPSAALTGLGEGVGWPEMDAADASDSPPREDDRPPFIRASVGLIGIRELLQSDPDPQPAAPTPHEPTDWPAVGQRIRARGAAVIRRLTDPMQLWRDVLAAKRQPLLPGEARDQRARKLEILVQDRLEELIG